MCPRGIAGGCTYVRDRPRADVTWNAPRFLSLSPFISFPSSPFFSLCSSLSPHDYNPGTVQHFPAISPFLAGAGSWDTQREVQCCRCSSRAPPRPQTQPSLRWLSTTMSPQAADEVNLQDLYSFYFYLVFKELADTCEKNSHCFAPFDCTTEGKCSFVYSADDHHTLSIC